MPEYRYLMRLNVRNEYMAYLTEQLTKQHSPLAVNNDRINNEGFSIERPCTDTEHDNFQIARELAAHKTRLIQALAQFPFTAQWLLIEYDKAVTDGDNDALVSDFAFALAEINRLYLAVRHRQGMACHAARLRLAAKLEHFPFSFSDLTQMAGIIFQVCQLRGANGDMADGFQASDDSHSKRITQQGRRHSDNTGRCAVWFEIVRQNEQDAESLFLPVTEMRRHVAEMVIAERRWREGRQKLAAANTKLVLFIANQYKSSFLDFDDLVQEGQTGLLKAVDKFDYQLGFQFSTYAGYWIRQAISRSLSRCERLVRIPCGQVANISKVYRAKNELTARTGQEPSVKELASVTKLSPEDVDAILSMSQSTVSLEGSDDDEAFAPIDFLEQQIFTHSFTTIADAELGHLLSKAIAALSPREAQVVRAHFGMDTCQEMTLQEIGSELKLTRERVRQIQVTALKKMKLDVGQQLAYFL